MQRQHSYGQLAQVLVGQQATQTASQPAVFLLAMCSNASMQNAEPDQDSAAGMCMVTKQPFGSQAYHMVKKSCATGQQNPSSVLDTFRALFAISWHAERTTGVRYWQ